MSEKTVLSSKEELSLEDYSFKYQWTWKVNKLGKIITVETDGRQPNLARIKLVRELGIKTHEDTDANLLNLFPDLEKIFGIKLEEGTLA